MLCAGDRRNWTLQVFFSVRPSLFSLLRVVTQPSVSSLPEFYSFHFSPTNICVFLFFRFSVSPPLECKLHEGRNFCLFCSPLNFQHLEQCLAHSRHWRIVEWINKLNKWIEVHLEVKERDVECPSWPFFLHLVYEVKSKVPCLMEGQWEWLQWDGSFRKMLRIYNSFCGNVKETDKV